MEDLYRKKKNSQIDNSLTILSFMLIPPDSRGMSPLPIIFVSLTERQELIMLVLCNFCQHTPLLTHLGDVIKRAVQYCRSIRVCFMICLLYKTHSLKLADPGKLFEQVYQQGLEAGLLLLGFRISFPTDSQTMLLQNLIGRLPCFLSFFGCLFANDFLVLSQMI